MLSCESRSICLNRSQTKRKGISKNNKKNDLLQFCFIAVLLPADCGFWFVFCFSASVTAASLFLSLVSPFLVLSLFVVVFPVFPFALPLQPCFVLLAALCASLLVPDPSLQSATEINIWFYQQIVAKVRRIFSKKKQRCSVGGE